MMDTANPLLLEQPATQSERALAEGWLGQLDVDPPVRLFGRPHGDVDVAVACSGGGASNGNGGGGDRIAVDARESGFLVTVQAPAGLAPRADARLIRVPLMASSPERVLANLMTAFGSRTLVTVTREPAPPSGAPLEAEEEPEGGGCATASASGRATWPLVLIGLWLAGRQAARPRDSRSPCR